MKTLAQKIEDMNAALNLYGNLKARQHELLASIDQKERNAEGHLIGKSREALDQCFVLGNQQDRASRKLRRLIHDVARTLNFGKLKLDSFSQLVSVCHQLTEISCKSETL